MILVLSIGAWSLGTAVLDRHPAAAAPTANPSAERVVHMAGLVAANSRESIDPLGTIPDRVPGSRVTSRALWPDNLDAAARQMPSGADGVLLILLAPALLVWTRRWGESWGGCWRYSAEVLLIVLAGLLGSMPLGPLPPLPSARGEAGALILVASVPLGLERTSSKRARALAGEGFH